MATPTDRLSKFLRFPAWVWELLTKPFEPLPKIDDYRKASITAAFMLISTLSVVAEQIVGGNTPILLIPAFGIMYLLGRTRWYKLAMLVLLIGLTYPSYGVLFRLQDPSSDRVYSAMVWTAVPIILCSLFYSVRTTALFTGLNVLLVGLLPLFHPTLSFQTLGGAWGFIIMISAVVLVVQSQREKIEQDRQQELRESQKQLQQEVAERRHMEEEVRTLNAELEKRVAARTAELERMNIELESFSYSVSHDLRAPLRAATSYARILFNDFSNEINEEGKSFLEKIIQSGVQMNMLIDGLLDFSRIGRSQLNIQPLDLNAIVDDVIRNLPSEEVSRRQIDWRVASLPNCHGDAVLLHQVYANLVSNAVKYTRPRAIGQIEIGSQLENGETIYFIRDNGAGFDMQYADKLFGVFSRLHHQDEFEGTGIGLSMVSRIVERHGGRIWAEAAVNEGAAFFFTLSEPEQGDEL